MNVDASRRAGVDNWNVHAYICRSGMFFKTISYLATTAVWKVVNFVGHCVSPRLLALQVLYISYEGLIKHLLRRVL